MGARWGVGARWAELAADVRVYGFDPDRAECDRLNQEAARRGDRTTTYVPVGLASVSGAATMYVTREPACSSLYRPIGALAESIPELACITETERTSVEVTTLDAWCEDNGVGAVDMIKLDVQGAELGVLEGATRALSTASLLEIEVEFNPIYEGQPLFGDVDAFVRRHGFALWSLNHLVHYTAGDGVAAVETVRSAHFDSVLFDAPGRGGQLYWGHAYFTRQELCPAATTHPSREQTARAAAVTRAAGLPDLATAIRLRPTRD